MELAEFDILAEPLVQRSVRNVSRDRFVWSYLADNQIKLNRSFRLLDWLSDSEGSR